MHEYTHIFPRIVFLFFYQIILFYRVRWEQYQHNATIYHSMIDQVNEKSAISPNKSEELYENNEDRRVTTTTNTGTMFRAWEMPHLQNTLVNYEQDGKYQSWQNAQHNEKFANSFEQNSRSYQRERGKVMFHYHFQLIFFKCKINFIYIYI